MSLSTRLGAAALAACLSLPATAETVPFDYQDAGSVFGSPNLSQVVRISSPDFIGGVRAGPFRLSGGGMDEFVAFCIDLAQRITNGGQYEENASLVSSERLGLLDRLFTSAYGQVDTAVEGAAFQLAIWEITNEDLSDAAFDITSGAFSASHNQAATNLAQGYLDGLVGAGTGGYRLSLWESAQHQDVVVPAPVPLPAGIVLLGTGLGGLALWRRRQTASVAQKT